MKKILDVGELMELLQQFPAGMEVVVTGYEGGYDPLIEAHIYTCKTQWAGSRLNELGALKADYGGVPRLVIGRSDSDWEG